MKPEEYANLLILYIITDIWDNNLKFAWKRLPSAMKKDKLIRKTWEIGQLLYKSDYLQAAAKINEYKGSQLDGWLKDGYKYLMHRLTTKIYSTITDDTLKALMGFTSDKEYKQYMKVHKNDFEGENTEAESIDISEEQMRTLKMLAQFIESETQLDREG